MRTALLTIALGLGACAAADAATPSRAATVPPPQADVAILSISESDRGGAPNDGDLWREQLTVAADGQPGVTLTRVLIANTPIPDSVENRRQFGQPLSAGGRATPPRPGPDRDPPEGVDR